MINKKETNLFIRLAQMFLVFSFMALLVPQICLGADALNRLKNVSKLSYEVERTTQNTLTEYIGSIISVVLGLMGTIFIILLIYSGYNWMTAAGNVEKVTKAQHTMRSAILGVIITVAVYAIWWFVFFNIVKT